MEIITQHLLGTILTAVVVIGTITGIIAANLGASAKHD